MDLKGAIFFKATPETKYFPLFSKIVSNNASAEDLPGKSYVSEINLEEEQWFTWLSFIWMSIQCLYHFCLEYSVG